MAAECVASALTHTSHAAQPVNSVMECIQIWHTDTHSRTHPLERRYEEPEHNARVRICKDTQQTEIQTIHPTHQLFTTVRSNKNNMSQFAKSICERNLKLWNSIWSLYLCLSLSISFFLPSIFLCFLSLQRKCSVAWARLKDDRSLYTLTTCITLMASKLDSNFQLWDVTRDELRRGRKPAAEGDSDVYWVFSSHYGMSLLTRRYHNMLQATDIVSISVPFCLDGNDSKGLKWSYRTRKSRVIEMQSTHSFFTPSVHSAVTTLSRVAYQHEPQEEKQQHLCLTERETVIEM